ncbi:diacylglyceryl transferase [Fibrobacterales bacterium]|nr:diacylglyceryl transferase [Fibrobacterales bacterium]
MQYDATTTRFFDIPPYIFFAIIGVVVASSIFMFLLLKYNYNIPQYTKTFFFSGIGLLVGAKLFGCFTGLYYALAHNEPINLETFINTGIVFYGGMIGFVISFMLICKYKNKKIDYGVLDLVAVCIPLFHIFGRLGCFFAGCCFGIENHSEFSVLYTTHVKEEVITLSRLPIQLIESGMNLLIFAVLITLLFKQKFKEHLLLVYLVVYAIMRIILEFFRGDEMRGVWNGVSFSQVVSVALLLGCVVFVVNKVIKGEKI